MNRSLSLLLFLPLLGSCTTISKEQCLAGNWAEYGYRDGANGTPTTRITEYADVCDRFGAQPDRTTYLSAHAEGAKTYCTYQRGVETSKSGEPYNQICSGELAQEYAGGYDVGLPLYCTYDNGFRRGKSGQDYNFACSGPLAPNFTNGYEDGKIVYAAIERRDDLADKHEDRVTSIEEARQELASPDLPKKERRRLRAKLAVLRLRLTSIETDIEQIEQSFDLTPVALSKPKSLSEFRAEN